MFATITVVTAWLPRIYVSSIKEDCSCVITSGLWSPYLERISLSVSKVLLTPRCLPSIVLGMLPQNLNEHVEAKEGSNLFTYFQ